ncbi:MAG: S-layer homology domain-containing protein [Defluviitaleaceae bacterium]|nr:S-layer homology domain-containing protein [Defluviitaleaceae bacterium]
MTLQKIGSKIFRRIITAVLAVLMIMPSMVVFADDYILRDQVQNIYTGRTQADALINAAQFNDVGSNSPIQEIVVRGVALGLIHGDGPNFLPNQNLSRLEALSFVMRTLGFSAVALTVGTAIALEEGITSPEDVLSTGYLAVAVQLGMIVPDDIDNMGANVTREEVAAWIFGAASAASPGIFDVTAALTRVYGFNDWRNISGPYLMAIEHVVAANIMRGDGTNFNPRGNITRGEMAQVLANMDSILFEINGWQRKHATVARVQDAQYVTTGEAALWRNIYVRLGDGTVDVLQYQIVENPSPQVMDRGAVVFNNGVVGGMGMLVAGDTIEYIVESDTNTVLYINVLSEAQTTYVEGRLFAINADESTIVLQNADNDSFMYSMAEGIIMHRRGNNYIMMDQERHNITTMPYGQNLRLTLRNNVVISISFVGLPVLVDEVRGLVVENNPAFGYMVIIDSNGQRRIMRYYENEMHVEKVRHFDTAVPSYINHLFPSFSFNPNATTIDNINPGDIVFIRPDPEDAGVILMISAATNYIMRYGRVSNITHHDGYLSLLFEFESGQTTWFDISTSILITRDGRRLNPLAIQTGDWARVLVNEAIIAPGHVMTSVVEMTIEGGNRHISSIVRGSLSGINSIQNQIVIEHAQTLAQTGWTDHREIAQFSISGNNIQFFYNDEQISRDQAVNMFGRRGDTTVYLALENHFAGEAVRMVSFRSEREERLPNDTVIHADGTGTIQLAGQIADINTDIGTIVRRHGRLVSGLDIFPSDYLTVVLSGAGTAAVIDIFERPDTSGLQIMRARVDEINDGASFTVQSMSQLFGNEWAFTPVQREFTIDPRTVFLPHGTFSLDTFLTYTETSVFDEVFTIVTDGARASHIFQHNFANRSARGTIFNVDGDVIHLRDVSIQDPVTGQWHVISNVNNTMTVTVDAGTLIGRNNAVVQPWALQNGDQLLIMTSDMPAPADREPGMNIQAQIIMVD